MKNIVVSNKHRLKLFERLGTPNHKYFVLDNILDLTKNHISEEKTDITDGKKINLMYTGVLNSNRMIEKLIKTIGNSTRFNLIIAGFTDDKESLMKLIQNYNNIEFKGALPQADVLSLIQSSCDYGIAFYNMDSLNNKYCAPLKIHEYFRFNKLVISFKNPPLVEIENNFGIIYTINNIDEILSDLEFLKIEKRLFNIKNNSFEIFRQKQNDKFNSEMNNIIKLFNSDQNFN
tara:strand:- start:26 stop:721 length:696 start_codon:yes stop_codon:yes gene_type:complete